MERGDTICLSGDLGTGKTTLVQGIAQGWGSLDDVSSPTYIIVNHYRRPDDQNLFHLDAYRLQSHNEAEYLDLNLMLESGTLVIEWPERIEPVLPSERLWIEMRWIADEQRGMTFLPIGVRYEFLLKEFRCSAFGG